MVTMLRRWTYLTRILRSFMARYLNGVPCAKKSARSTLTLAEVDHANPTGVFSVEKTKTVVLVSFEPISTRKIQVGILHHVCQLMNQEKRRCGIGLDWFQKSLSDVENCNYSKNSFKFHHRSDL